MTTLKKTNIRLAARHDAALGFVLSDSAALASHMSNCASVRSRFFNLHAALECGHALLCTRMVTCILIVSAAVGVLSLFGMV